MASARERRTSQNSVSLVYQNISCPLKLLTARSLIIPRERDSIFLSIGEIKWERRSGGGGGCAPLTFVTGGLAVNAITTNAGTPAE